MSVSASASFLSRALLLLLGAWLSLVALPAHAANCTVTGNVTTVWTNYSPAAVKAGAVPALQSRAGLSCPVAILKLLSSNYIKAKFSTQQNLRLKLDGVNAYIPYTASAAPNGTGAFSQNGTVDYMQNNLLDLLGLLSASDADLPISVKPTAFAANAAAPAAGTYRDRITIAWSWYQCLGGVDLIGLCLLGTPETGSGTSVIDVSLTIAARKVTLSLSTATTWDGANGTLNPKALPGSRRRTTVTVANPDIVPVDSGKIAVVLATPADTRIALDGDGAGNSNPFVLTDGFPASNVAFRFGGGADTTDDVDFSSDGKDPLLADKNWTFAPGSDATSQAAVTHVRLRPRLAMARESSFALGVSYLVKPTRPN